jgi:hypothetical protein
MIDPETLAERYVAVWNERDADRRRRTIADLWVPEGAHFVGTREARGYDALEQRITGSHEKNVAEVGNRFRTVPGAKALRDSVTLFWEMLAPDGKQVLATGLEFLLLDSSGQILTDYMFVLDQVTLRR